jgi:hypothetical protein
MSNTKNNTLKLSHGTIFPDLNKHKGLDPNYVTTELELSILKYGHIREMQQIKPDEHMSFAMTVLTGLSEKDINEFESNDAAELMKIVYENLKGHMELAKNFLATDFGQNSLANVMKLSEVNRNSI